MATIRAQETGQVICFIVLLKPKAGVLSIPKLIFSSLHIPPPKEKKKPGIVPFLV